ncbi:EAL domain-containing protein [Marinobacterium jannaschii]|uniref:EAL domain-containing protein n=1 Tax=Marinobacterium jannaschii TaxID=64970 RepID=UPI0006867A9C|nr:EAL domain-containing protein [Marinobacterium jannaschii]
MFQDTIVSIMDKVLHQIQRDTLVADAARLLCDVEVKALLVVEQGDLVGIITETNILPALHQRECDRITAGQIMSAPVETVTPDTSISDALSLLEERHIRHLVVADDDGVLGLCNRHQLVRAYHNSLNTEASHPFRSLQPQEQIGNLGGLLSPEGILLGANSTALELIRSPIATVIGRYFWDTPWWAHNKPQQQQLKEAIGRAAQGESVYMTASHLTPDGAERSINFSISPIHDQTGKVIYLLPQGTDITDYQNSAQKLKESEERFRHLFEKSRSVEMIIDPVTGLIIDANEAASLFYGWSRSELQQIRIWDINSLSATEVKQEMAAAQAERREYFFFKHYTASGEIRDVEVHSSPIQIDNRQLLYSIIHDVTDRKQNELLQSGQQRILEMTLSDNMDLKAILNEVALLAETLQPEMRASLLLLRGSQLFNGASPNLPASYTETIEGLEIGPQAGSCGTSAALKKRVIVEDIATDSKWVDFRTPALSVGLRACWSQPILSSNCEVLGTFAMYYQRPKRPTLPEISLIESLARLAGLAIDRLRVLQALRRSEARFGSIFNNAPLGVAEVSPEGILQELNPLFARLMGYSVAELIGKHFRDITYPDDKQANLALLQQMIRGELRSTSLEKRYVRRDGSVFWANLTLSGIYDERQQLTSIVSMIQDIDERKRTNQAIEDKQNFLQTVVDGVSDPIMVVDPEYQVLLTNRAANERHAELLVQSDNGQLNRKARETEQIKTIDQVIRSGKACKTVIDETLPDGDVRNVELIATPCFNAEGKIDYIIKSSRDITEHLAALEQLQENQQHLDFLARRDTLTGLPNRLMFQDRMECALQRAMRTDSKLALLFIDLDRFKQINDSLGHNVGDLVLQEAARRLQLCLRGEDSVARLGGDEFTAIIEELKASEDSAKVATKILNSLNEPFHYQGQNLFLGASIGISLYPDDGCTTSELMRNADSAMYDAKEAGRDCYRFYQASMTEEAMNRVSLESYLRRALEKQELQLVYQPQVDMSQGDPARGTVFGLEALLRWQHPQLGLLTPDTFLPIAEDTGLILSMGEWVLETACRDIVRINQGQKVPLRMAVNISGHQLRKADFVEQVKRIIADTGCRPADLQLEITENAITGTPKQFAPVLNALKAVGITLAIDDFGTGSTSLGHLKQLPIDELKIDRSFVRDIPDDKDDEAITRAVIALGQSLNMKVIAEGVENQLQSQFLLQHGCNLAQGYYYARPAPLAELMSQLAEPDAARQPDRVTTAH